MRIYIPAAYRAALMLFRRGTPEDHARADAIDDARKDLEHTIFDALQAGTIDTAHQRTPHSLIIYHRSSRKGCIVQRSHFFRTTTADDWTPIRHAEINTPEEMDIKPGMYITIA